MISLSYSDYISVLIMDLFKLFWLHWYNQNNIAWSLGMIYCRMFLGYRLVHIYYNTKAYSEPCQTCRMDLFAKILNNFRQLPAFQKSRISLWQWYGLKAFTQDLNNTKKDIGKVGLLLNCIKRFHLYFYYL